MSICVVANQLQSLPPPITLGSLASKTKIGQYPCLPLFRNQELFSPNPLWTTLAITPNLRYAIVQAFPNDNLPSPSITAQEYVDTLEAACSERPLRQNSQRDRDATLESTNILLFRALHTLAIIYAELGEWQNAESTCKKFLAESDKILGPDSKVAIRAVSNLGESLLSSRGTMRRLKLHFDERSCGREIILEGESPWYLGAVRGLIPVLTR